MFREDVIRFQRTDGQIENRRALFVLDSQWMETKQGFVRLWALSDKDDPDDPETVFVAADAEPMNQAAFWYETFRDVLDATPPTVADIALFTGETHIGAIEDDEEIARDGDTYWVRRRDRMMEVEPVESPDFEDEFIYVPAKPPRFQDAACFWMEMTFLVALYAARRTEKQPAKEPVHYQRPRAYAASVADAL